MQTVEELQRQGIQIAVFYEPDYNMGYTAAATEPIAADQRRLFKKFRLWTADKVQ